MKFDDVKSFEEDKKKDIDIKKTTPPQTQKHVINYMYRFGNVGVYIMKNGKKGLFREISTYINDGEKPTSWALKIYHTDGWYIQFGINANVDFTKNDIFLSEMFSVFKEKYENIEISGNRKMVIISEIEDRHQVEHIANYIVNTFKDIELDFADAEVFPLFTMEEFNKPLRIIGFYSDSGKDEESHKKFENIVEKLSSIQLSATDDKNFKIVSSKIKSSKPLKEKDKSILDGLMKDYLSDHDRISIAMKYLRDEE